MLPPLKGEVDLVLVGKCDALLRSEQLADETVGVLRCQLGLMEGLELTVDTQDGRRAGAEDDVGTPPLEQGVEELGEGHLHCEAIEAAAALPVLMQLR